MYTISFKPKKISKLQFTKVAKQRRVVNKKGTMMVKIGELQTSYLKTSGKSFQDASALR